MTYVTVITLLLLRHCLRRCRGTLLLLDLCRRRGYCGSTCRGQCSAHLLLE